MGVAKAPLCNLGNGASLEDVQEAVLRLRPMARLSQDSNIFRTFITDDEGYMMYGPFYAVWLSASLTSAPHHA